MANEYLKRTPTSTGNRRVWTWSGWIKFEKDKGDAYIWHCTTDTANHGFITYRNGNIAFAFNVSSTNYLNVSTVSKIRDFSSWTNLIVVLDTTQTSSRNRYGIYINGIYQPLTITTEPTINISSNFNTAAPHFLGVYGSSISSTYSTEANIADVFFIDGQALTPDVFGFYKVGKGYISAGSTQSTDFRPGQWVPKTPRVIKTAINNSGGFGVNGFYLPMNDSNNFGADFHCEPNSIIKLQENLPQPRSRIDGVGDYTGALRDDPFKQYLVLALPFVSGGLQNGFGDYSAAIKGSGSPKSITVTGTVSIANTASYYGSAALFNATSAAENNLLTVNNAVCDFGTGDFTVEVWGYPFVIDTGNNNYIMETTGLGGTRFTIVRVGGENIGEYYLVIGNNVYTITGTNYGINQWHHLAVCRKNGVVTAYLNGVATYTNTITTDITAQSGVYIGSYQPNASEIYEYQGYLQDLRIYKGVAKYKGGFDVPRPYTPVGIATWRAVPDSPANNFATLNPLIGTPTNGNVSTLVNGNLTKSQVNASRTSSTILTPKTGKWYAEFHASGSGSIFPYTGVALANSEPATIGGQSNAFQVANITSYTGVNYHLFNSATVQSETNPPGLGDILGVALDVDNGIVYYYKNGTLLRTDNTLNKSDNYVFLVQTTNDGAGGTAWYTSNANFGQNPSFSGNTTAGTYTDSNNKGLFKYQPPSGFLALCEDNLPTPAISDPGKHFKTVLWTGDPNDTKKITGVGFTPDLIWVKGRDLNQNHTIYDSIRGSDKRLFPNSTNSEDTSSNTLLSFDNDGFSIGGNNFVNSDGNSHVAWCWKAGAGTTSTNTNGSITSVVSVNQDAGFSVVSYTGTGASNATVGHGLGKVPAFGVVKCRDTNSVSNDWRAQHKGLTYGYYIVLSSTAAQAQISATSFGSLGTFTSSSTVTLQAGTSDSTTTNESGKRYIMYLWAEIEGFSKFGSYTGNGSTDGPFVYCGFKPAWVMIKSTDASNGWIIMDNARKPINPNGEVLFANEAIIEQTDLNYRYTDFVSNGFKIRAGIGSERNSDGVPYIFVAFAESPFQTANAK